MTARVVLLAAVLALALRVWWYGRPPAPVYVGAHRAPELNPHRLLGTARPALSSVVAHCWAHDL